MGYISPDLFTHSVSYFAEAPLGCHNPARVTLFVYSCVGKPDAKTLCLQAKVRAVPLCCVLVLCCVSCLQHAGSLSEHAFAAALA